MVQAAVSAYQREQLESFQAIRAGCARLSAVEIAELLKQLEPYLDFRRELAAHQLENFHGFCRDACFTTRLSACCGFESIITFFADQLITYLLSGEDEREGLFQVLQAPNRSQRCVYLGPDGCIWPLPPVSCAMFLCDPLKQAIFAAQPEQRGHWQRLQAREREFTHPDHPVLFDTLERDFLRRGIRTPHMYYHVSPGLLRIKADAGLLDAYCRQRRSSRTASRRTGAPSCSTSTRL